MTLQAKITTDKIIQEIDKTLMLGGAWDCMTDREQTRFKAKLVKLLETRYGTEE